MSRRGSRLSAASSALEPSAAKNTSHLRSWLVRCDVQPSCIARTGNPVVILAPQTRRPELQVPKKQVILLA